tara:strand:+ start:8736 stop:9566 length:831 start_codon:yes stop_codon:yes gene_type:complete
MLKKTKKCHRCKPGSKKISNIDNSWSLPKLFKEISPNYAIPKCHSNLKDRNPKKSNLEDIINLGPKYSNRKIFFFATHQKKMKDCDIILDASKAYDDLSNQGITTTNSKGIANFSVICPQGYREEGNTYISHIHFIVSNKKNNSWIPKMKTQRVSCNISHKKMKIIIEKECAVILNALEAKYYIKKRIPNSFNLPYKLINELTDKEIKTYIKSLVPNYKKLKKNKKLSFLELPIVVYCYYSKCNASEILKEHLIKIGFNNVREYKLGIKGWVKREH